MALEDRCSPQSAPSPPGIPHSPQSTSSPVILDMSIHSHHNHSLLMQQHTEQGFYANPYGKHVGSRLTPDLTVVKEENDSIMSGDHDNDPDDGDDQEIDIGCREDSVQGQRQQVPVLPMISFSITNILSDRFGRKNPSSVCTEKKSSAGIFRPFETQNQNQNQYHNRPVSSNGQSERSAFTRLAPEVLDYSRAAILQHHNPAAALMMDRTNFLNCFNPVAYPRIHEEILNQTRKYKHTNSIEGKMPPLGSLCKTVSQIGQTAPPSSSCSSSSSSNGMCISSPPPPSSMSSVSSTASASPSLRIPSSPQPIPPQSISRDSGMESSDDTRSESGSTKDENGQLWPAWVYCTRYSDRPSSGPRYRRPKKPKDKTQVEEKRPRTAFSSEQLARLKREFNENRYLTERRRQQLSGELGLNEAQIKIWFQNKRAKIKKSSGTKNPLALQLMAQGLYNHSTVPLTKEEEELEMRMNGQL